MPLLEQRIDLRYRLHFNSAFHFGTGMRAGLVHRAIARRRDGFPYVPGSTLKGVLRDHATQIARLFDVPIKAPHPEGEEDVGEFAPVADLVAAIFGSRVYPGALTFDDATLCTEDERLLTIGEGKQARLILAPSETRTRVTMSRRLGTAQRGLLFTSEYGLRDLRFDGRITGVFTGVPLLGDNGNSYELAVLLAALHSIERIGGNTSVGAGRVHCAIQSLAINGTQWDAAKISKLLEGLTELDVYELSREDAEGGS